MKLSKINIIIPFIFLLAWSCKPKCPVYSCKIRMHHRHGLIMKPRTLEEWGKEVNQKLNGGDTTQTDSVATEGMSSMDSAYVNLTGDTTLAKTEPKLSKKERKAKRKQEKEEKKRKKKEEKEAKRKEKEEAKEAKRKEKEEARIAAGKPPKKKKEKKKKKKDKEEEEASAESPEEEVDPEFSAEEEGEEEEKEDDPSEQVYRSRMIPWWIGQKRKPKVGQRWKPPKNKEKKKRSKKHNERAKK